MNYPASGGKTISALFATAALIAAYALHQNKIDKIACTESRNAIEEKRNRINTLKTQENI